MNTKRGKAEIKNFRILLNSGCSSAVVVGRLVEKIHLEKDAVIQWHMQAGTVTTKLKVKVGANLTVLSATNVMTCEFHVDKYAWGG